MNRSSMQAEDELLTRMRANDQAAYAEFVRAYGGRILCVAKRFLRNEHDAADAVQDTFLSAFKSLSRFIGESSLATWLHRITINVCLMKLRSRSRHQDCLLEDLLPDFDRAGHHLEPVAKWSAFTGDTLELDESKARVRACIDTLPDDYRVVLMLRDIEQLDTDQTAELLNVTTGTVKTRLHRARQALRTLLEPYFV